MALGILPIFSLGSSSTRIIHQAQGHILANEVAISLLERFSNLPFQKCHQELNRMTSHLQKLTDDPLWGPILTSETELPSELHADLRREYAGMAYAIDVYRDQEPEPLQILLRVTVFWNYDQSRKAYLAAVTKSLLKYRESL
jgi:hypothetical protein